MDFITSAVGPDSIHGDGHADLVTLLLAFQFTRILCIWYTVSRCMQHFH